MTDAAEKSPDSIQGMTNRRIMLAFLTFALVLTVSWTHRIAITMIFYFNNNGFAWHYRAMDGHNPLFKYFEAYGQSILLGLKTDALFAVPVAMVLALFGWVGLVIGLILLAFFYAANSEHVRYNESNIDLSLIGLAADPTFIAGQTTVTLFIYFFGFLAVGAMLLWFARRSWTRIAICVASVILAVSAVIAPTTTRYDQPVWMQTHPMMPRIGIPELAIDDRAFSDVDYTNVPKPPASVPGQHNVLLVFLEGLSEYSLTKSDMTNLQDIAAKNIHFRQYIGHQLLTANGIYSTHTAELPYFTNVPMRWYELNDSSPATQTALPRILKNQGYQTSFLQAAPLEFMRKDEKLPLLGYDNLIGARDIPNPRLRNGWGVDDLTLFETALTQIDQFEHGRPWFMSVLTTGTHSPYNVPADYLPDAETDRYRASHYADAAAQVLVDGLRDRGLLENTVVIFTSDESREFSPGTQLETDIHRSWLPFIMLHPNGLQTQIDAPFAMTDTRNMVLAATGDLTRDAINQLVVPRDIFMFGNVRLEQMFYFDESAQQLFACSTDRFVCYAYDNVTDLRDLEDAALSKIARFTGLERIVRAREGQEVDCDVDIAICQ